MGESRKEMNGLLEFISSSEVRRGLLWTHRNTCPKCDATAITSDNVSALSPTMGFFFPLTKESPPSGPSYDKVGYIFRFS